MIAGEEDLEKKPLPQPSADEEGIQEETFYSSAGEEEMEEELPHSYAAD